MNSGKALICVPLLAMTVAACTSSAAAHASSSGPAGHGQLVTPACAWSLESNAGLLDQINNSNPDVESDYWIMEFTVQRGLSIALSGHFPDSRYFSFEVYNSKGLPFTENGVASVLTDYRVAPDPGSVNPWQSKAEPGGSYTVTLRSDVAAGQVNTLPLAPAGTAAGTIGIVFLRVYVAHGSPAQVPLPAVTFTAGGTSRRLPACRAYNTAEPPDAAALAGSRPSAAELAELKVGLSFYGGVVPFARRSSGGGTTPDSDTGYVFAFVRPPGRGAVVVIRGQAPTSPAGANPSPWPAPGVDLQYWSLCNDVLLPNQPVVVNHLPGGTTDYGCRYDSQVKLDQDGYYTFVLGTESQRAAIEKIPGATFLPFSAAHPDGIHFLALRNMVASAGFAQAIQNVPVNGNPSSAAAVMGPYYPRTAVCPLATLAARGAAACLAAH
jgi:hypothetical protein